jgi:hypothetical protein
MNGVFDPYHIWLGIPPAEQPPNYYRLLGLAQFEANPGVVDHAAQRVLMHLRTMSGGPHAAYSQRLIGEVTAARMCLLDANQKASYDRELRGRLGATSMPSASTGRRGMILLSPVPRNMSAHFIRPFDCAV